MRNTVAVGVALLVLGGAAFVVLVHHWSNAFNIHMVSWELASSAWFLCVVALFLSGVIRSPAKNPNARQDPLTGLSGLESFQRALQREVDRAGRTGQHVGVVTARLECDSAFGIREYVAWRLAAKLLKTAIRSVDDVYVLEPGRFAILLSSTRQEGCDKVIQRVQCAFNDEPGMRGKLFVFDRHLIDPMFATQPCYAALLKN